MPSMNGEKRAGKGVESQDQVETISGMSELPRTSREGRLCICSGRKGGAWNHLIVGFTVSDIQRATPEHGQKLLPR